LNKAENIKVEDFKNRRSSTQIKETKIEKSKVPPINYY
jgi:hypothetical protein